MPPAGMCMAEAKKWGRASMLASATTHGHVEHQYILFW